MTAEIADRDVAAVFGSYPGAIADQLLAIRAVIFETARNTPGVGPLTEALRWGQPSYLTMSPKTGTMIRLGWHPARIIGKREIRFDDQHPVPTAELSHIITLALTYYR